MDILLLYRVFDDMKIVHYVMLYNRQRYISYILSKVADKGLVWKGGEGGGLSVVSIETVFLVIMLLLAVNKALVCPLCTWKPYKNLKTYSLQNIAPYPCK